MLRNKLHKLIICNDKDVKLMSNIDNSSNLAIRSFFSELMKVSTDIVWKNKSLADIYEKNNPNYIEVEMFINAKRDMLTFESIYQFDYDVLISAELTPSQAYAGMDKKSTIPTQYRQLCAKKYMEKLTMIDSTTGKYLNYNEYNNYYRMLYGLPDIEDTEYIYNVEYDDIPSDIPIHLLSTNDKYLLEIRGYIQKLIDEYPTKKYLKYLTSKCIDPYIARSSEMFSILWMNSSSYLKIEEDFKSVYNDCKNNIVKVYYTDAFKKNNPLYDNFIAMCILFMTIQLMHYKYLDADIERDFYDLDSIKYVYDSYGIPFYPQIPIEYHKRIIKNINNLLSYKGSTRVIFDLFDLFDYDGTDIYEYYLLKSHKFENNLPIFPKKIDGTYDYRNMYDVKFVKVRLYDNPQMEISLPSNHILYDNVVSVDPYWISDEALLDKLYEEEYNYRETKYMGIQIVYNMYKIMSESVYFFKLIADNRDKDIFGSIYVSTIFKNYNIFNVFVYACALYCRKYGYAGNISSNLPVVSKLLGFNFKADLNIIKTDILNDQYMSLDNDLIDLLTNMDVNNLQSVNNTFLKITNLRELIAERKFSAKSREEFFAYYNLEKTLLTSDFIEDAYKKSDSTIAETFNDLLQDLDTDMYNRIINVDLDVDHELDALLIDISRSISNLKYITYADGINNSTVLDYLFKIIDFFKSAKSDLTGYNVVFTLSSKGINNLKYLDLISSEIRDYPFPLEDIIDYLSDLLKLRTEYLTIKDKMDDIINKDEIDSILTVDILHSYIESLSDKIKTIDESIRILSKESDLEFLDIINIFTETTTKSPLLLSDKLFLVSSSIII